MLQENPLEPQIFRIQANLQEAPDVFTLTLTTPNDKPFSSMPGQFNMLYALGVGEAAISLSGSPNQRGEIVHTIRAVGSVTKHLCKLVKNDFVGIRGPFGKPWPMALCQEKEVILIAGGIGLAPLRSALYQIEKENPAKVTLIYGARTPTDIIYAKEIEQWRKKFNVLVTVDKATSLWPYHIGVNTKLIPKAISNPEKTLVFMCGPEVMMRFCLPILNSFHIPYEQIYLSMERNMQCAIGHCGHCQWGPFFICKDGPVMQFKQIESFFYKTEL